MALNNNGKILLYIANIYFLLFTLNGDQQYSLAQQNVLVQINYVGPPKILPIATADSYPEGSSINLICTVSGGQRKGLHLGWVIQGREVDHQSIRRLTQNGDESLPENLSIGQDGSDISILRISNATHVNSGEYSCIAKNPLGEDSTTVKIVINVELKWKKAPKDTEIGLNQDLALECEAVGMPEPKIEWVKHPSTTSDRNSGSTLANSSSLVIARGTTLKISKAQNRDSGIYECIARNGLEQDLRRIFQVGVRVVPAKFAEKFSVVQAKGGESAKLECNATGDQPLTVNWFKEETKLSKRGGENFEIYETITSSGINSVLVIRALNRADGITYKCIAENEYGNDERNIKLMVVEVPSRPISVRIKDTWSRSASIVWSTPFSGNSPITNYIIQYWRKATNEAGQSVGQNHRRQEVTIGGTQNSALINGLSPALQYEASVIAENQVGRGEPSDNVIINTGEDEPSSSPADVAAEARGPSTIKVSWKVPPSDAWNGKLRGFYLGFRPRINPNTIDIQSVTGAGPGFSHKTVEYVSGQQVYETFLTNLARGQDYDIIVKAFNNMGSSPESHMMSVRTFDGDLPASPNLFAHQTSHSSINLRWTYPSRAHSSASNLRRYVLYYQRQGDDSWLEIGIPIEERIRTMPNQIQQDGPMQISAAQMSSVSETGSVSYHLTGLDHGTTYKIYVVAVNNFGMGDPSNFVTTKTEQLNGVAENLGSSMTLGGLDINNLRQQVIYFLAVPIICTIILVIVIISAFVYCTRKIQGTTSSRIMTPGQQQTLQSNQGSLWGPENCVPHGGQQRYLEFDKGGILKTNNALLVGTTQSNEQNSLGHPANNNNQGYQLPYGTMPMNSVVISDQKSWDRQSGPLKPLMNHIYDSPI